MEMNGYEKGKRYICRLDSKRVKWQMVCGGISRTEIAEKANRTYSTVYRAVNGEWVDIEAARAICKVLDIPLSEVMLETRLRQTLMRRFDGSVIISPERVMRRLTEKGWNFAELARATGVSRERIRQIAAPPRVMYKTARKLADALGVDVKEIAVDAEGVLDDAGADVYAGTAAAGETNRADGGEAAGNR